eukprot:Amastigsp_a6512_12.p2 type:complete len:191 gc:universal Amastigsp_a6512_12:55-627(+)
MGAGCSCGVPVDLYCYDLSGGLAATLSQFFAGPQIEAIWHTGVVVHGYEFYYGSGGGIARARAGKTHHGEPLRIHRLGNTGATLEQIEVFLATLTKEFSGSNYDLLKHNCTHFSERLSKFLTGRSIPDYILNQAKLINKKLSGGLDALAGLLRGLRVDVSDDDVTYEARSNRRAPSSLPYEYSDYEPSTR